MFKRHWRKGLRVRVPPRPHIHKNQTSRGLVFMCVWNYTTLLEHFLKGTDRLRFAPAERSDAAEFSLLPFRLFRLVRPILAAQREARIEFRKRCHLFQYMLSITLLLQHTPGFSFEPGMPALGPRGSSYQHENPSPHFA